MVRFADDVTAQGTESRAVVVEISYEVIKLFSEQLYASPLKAIEELVVNAWDADATRCSVLVESSTAERPVIAVFDDGKGMALDALENLWHIGVSNKVALTASRKQIGKFGIGKLASYAVARRVTYVSKTAEGIHAVMVDFEEFAKATDPATGKTKPVSLSLRTLPSVDSVMKMKGFESAAAVLQMDGKPIDLKMTPTWTLVVLEDLRERAHQLQMGRLQWVLSTAMPLESDFALYLNGKKVEPSKSKYEKVVEFTADQLSDVRLNDLAVVTGETWSRIARGLKSDSFPEGITGDIVVTRHSLYSEGGKSEDLGRSHGFFVRVHNRLINEADPLFGARPLSFTTFYRFAAIIEAPDLNRYVTASRDDIEQSGLKSKLRDFLIALFNEARERFEAINEEEERENKRKKEGQRDYVSTELVERPLADALVVDLASRGPEPNDKTDWVLVERVDNVADLQTIVEQLYDVDRAKRKYSFTYSAAGALSPIAKLNATTATIVINEDHQLVQEFSEKPESKRLLEALVVAETLLEVYLRAAHVEAEVIVELLERRDSLLRSLATDESYALKALARALRDAKDDEHDLEIALVGALRALGFSAQHISGSGTPDGKANYVVHGAEDASFTLEAKSSASVPTLAQLDFAGLRSHYVAYHAQGCLLVAPSFPNADDPEGQVSLRARDQKISCWTIEQLALVVENAEKRHVNAREIQELVLRAYSPIEVTAGVQKLLSEPTFDHVELYMAVVAALRSLERRLKGTPRNVSMLAAEVSRENKFQDVTAEDVRDAVVDLSHASRGMLHLTENNEVFVLGSLDEMERRISSMTTGDTPPRRLGTFRNSDPT
jgi:Histidine kinase-, DNA gyrase B-, and HSP90-like ATPase